MARFAAGLPDALVGVLPAGCGGVGEADQEPSVEVVEVADLVAEAVDGGQQLPVGVQLALRPGAVAGPQRTAAPPAVEPLEGAFGEVALTVNAEHDLQLPGFVEGARHGREVGEEAFGLAVPGVHHTTAGPSATSSWIPRSSWSRRSG